MTNLFKIDDLVKIAKRENNTKRSYLYVNPVQGKHVPVSPSLPLLLFSALAAKIESRYPEERLLVIGFAETATAIGSFFNSCMNLLPMIAPDELAAAASKVALFDMPKPTNRGFRRPIPLMRWK